MEGMVRMKAGKLDSELLKEIVFKHIKLNRKEVLVRPAIGEDCAVVDFGEEACVLSTDPITGAVNEVGRLSVHISCNDIASSGTEPIGIMLTIMVPEGTTEEQIEEIMRQASEEAERLNVEIIGGHTEITNAVNKTVIVSTAIGKNQKEKLVKKSPVKPGDAIILTKYAGLEGTGIIATDYIDKLKQHLTNDELNRAKDMLNQLSVVKEGVIAGKAGALEMHDVTEGGVLGAVWEICERTGSGARIDYDKIPITKETLKICQIFGLDCLRLISSGCMMMVVSGEKTQEVLSALHQEQIPASQIGVVTEKGRYMLKDGLEIEIQPPASDELYKVL